MKKIYCFFCLILLTACMSGFAQGPTTITIGTGTNDSYNLPINNYYKNSWSEMIYPASDITERGYITSIGFDVSSVADGYMCNTLTIYMGVTSNEAHNSNSDWLPMEELTEVYSDTDWPLPTATGWLTFDLDNPFLLEGNDNLVIVISKTMPNYTSALKFRYTEGAANCCLYRRSDNNPDDYASHPGGNTGTLTNQLPNLQLTFSTITDFCHTVTDFAVTDISAYDATFSWTAPEDASNYILQCKLAQEDWESENVITVYPTETPYTLTNLTPNIYYNVRIANDCGNEEYSSWRHTAFQTECVAFSVTEAPYDEQFEGYAAHAFPDCWTLLSGYNSGSSNYPYITNSSSNVHSGTGSLFMYNNADNPIITALPPFVEDLNTLRLSFWMKPVGTSSEYGYLELGVMTDLTDNATFALLHSWSAVEIGSTEWTYYEINLDTTAAPTTGYLVFRKYTEYTYARAWYLDDVRVMPIPSCATPTGLSVSFAHSYSADLFWDDMPGTYNIYYKTDGDAEYSSINNVEVTDNVYVLGNLEPSTTYQVYVAAICEDGSEAPSSSSVIFTTLCAPETTPYSEDFNASNTIPNCWEQLTGLVSDAFAGTAPVLNTSTSSYSKWAFNNTNVFGEYHPKVNIYSTNCRYWLVSPTIDLSSLNNPTLTFDLALTAYNNSNPPSSIGEDDRFLVLISTDGGATWSADNAIEWNITGTGDYALNQIPAIGDEMTISLAQYAGQSIRIAFYGESTASGGDIDLHIDNVAVNEFTTCPRPAQLQAANITTHSAEISWVEKGEASSWSVEYGPLGFASGSGTVITVTDEPATVLYGLTPSTDYGFRVSANCGETVSYPRSATFRTADCETLTLPFTEEFESYTTSTTASTEIAPACWELVQEDVDMTDATRPQLYYKSTFAHSGDYSLKLHNRGVYAMPALADNIEMKYVHLEMYLRQPNAAYQLQVGVWEDEEGVFVPVATFNNSTTGVELVDCDFSDYTGTGRRIAFRNVLGSGNYAYSYNYIDDITLSESALIPATLPYYTDFSEDNDQNWRLKNGACTNNWMMGSPDENTPNALFITSDGATAGYDINNGSTVMAEKAFFMPATDFVHVEFDVLVGGQTYYDYLKVFLTPVDETFDAGTGHNAQSGNSYSANALDFSDYKSMTGLNAYPYMLNLTNGNTLHISANMLNPDLNGTGKIVFLWRDNDYNGTQPGAVITNFSIEEIANEDVLPPTVTTGEIYNIMTDFATCSGNVTDKGGASLIERGVCWSTSPEPTLEDAHISNGNGLGEFTCHLTGLVQGTTYYVRAYASNLAGTGYGEEWSFTTACETLTLPYSDDFDNYTTDTAVATGVEPTCWELVQEDVAMTDENRPQLIRSSDYTHSGDYSLRLKYRGIYAMPELSENFAIKHVHLEMYLKQPKTYYILEVGVWEEDGTFVPVATFNNSTTGMKHVECDFSNYEGSGRRIAFHNILGSGNTYNYSYNFIDDIVLTEAEGCEITFEMHDSYGDGWNGNTILIHNDGTEKEVTLGSGHDDTITVTVHNGPIEFEWVNGSYVGECSFTLTGPSCLYHQGSSMSPGIFHSTEMDCNNDNPPAIPAFSYWMENTCNSVLVHFENNSANAENAVWDFGDGITSDEIAPVHEYTADGEYFVTLSVNNSMCEELNTFSQYVTVTMPEPITTFEEVIVCAADLPYFWNGMEIYDEGDYMVTLSSTNGCDSTVVLTFITQRIDLPYTENFEYYTESTTPATGVEPDCWELVQEDVPMPDNKRPQLYYKSEFAHDGDYSLKMENRCIYAMPALSEEIPMNQIRLEMYLRQPNGVYQLQVGVWEDDGTFVPMATFNNSTTEVEFVECDFTEYTGESRRIAFRNVLGNNKNYDYSYNYLDAITLTFAIPANDAKPCPGHETVTDYDGNVYNTVKIGDQCWMKENLRVTHYEDGVEIPLVSNIASVDIAYRYNPDNNGNNVPTYGYLYNWAAIMHGNASNEDNPGGVQGICPQGWHLPSDAEWSQLMDHTYSIQAYLCNEDSYVKALATQTGWYSSDNTCSVGNNPNENNATGFSALPAGLYSGWGNNYDGYNYYADFWSATQNDDWQAMLYHINYEQDYVDQYSNDKYDGKSVRCVLGEGLNLAAVTTGSVRNITSNDATCGGNVTYDGNTPVFERGICWGTEPNPTLDYNEYVVDGSGTGKFTGQLSNLWPGTTYYVRAYATNSMGTVYGEDVTFMTCGGSLAVPYFDDFENYTESTSPSTSVEPSCWELVQEDVEMPDNKKPQLYYKSSFAHSGDYSLAMINRGVYAMPPIEDNLAMKHVHLDMYLRQPNAAYRLQVGVWDDATGTFTPVATFNNSTTEVEHVECDFSNYTGNGRRVAFRNVLGSGNYAYSYNYIDDITLSEAEGCELTIEMHNNAGYADWGGSLIRIYTDGSVKEVTLDNAYDDAVTVTVHNGMLDLEWEYNGWYPAEWMSFTVSGPCLYYSTERASYETEYFYSTELYCDGNGTTSIPDFDYWTENVCNNVVVHFENNSTDAEYSVWDFGDWGTSEEDNPSHEYTVSNVYPVTLSVHNVTCDEFSVIKKYIEVNMPDPITISLDTIVCAAELPLTWYGQEITHGGIYSTTLQTAAGCDSTVYMNFTLLESTFAHTPDTLVSANEPVTLWAAGSGDFVWTDADGNVIGEGNNITVIPTENTTYYVTKPGENQIIQGNVVNGDFEYGTTGFSTQYSYYSQGACGCYYIDYDSYYWNWGYGNTTDHTTGSGLFMMVDATSYSNIWTQTVNVTPHTNYIFSAWFLTLSYANISYYVNGENITNFDFLETGNIWEQHSGTWYSGDNTTATLSINTEWADCGGYDFGIDDIMLYNGSCSSTESISLTVPPTGDAQPCPGIATMTDYDGNVYNTVKIGNQCWMKENLKTTHYADGEEIAWGEEASINTPYLYGPGYDFDDHSYYVEVYGYLYNWAAAMHGANGSATNQGDVQGVCPDGWHVPSNAEWAQLTDYVGSVPAYQCGGSNDIAKALVLPEGWNWWWDNECGPGYSNENPSGFNTTGFGVRPAGSYSGNYSPAYGGNYYTNYNGNYYDFTNYATFWSSTKSGNLNAWGIQLFCNVSGVYRYYFSKKNAFSVRCVYNDAIASIPTVRTDTTPTRITPTYATFGGYVVDDGGADVIERGVCWSAEHTPTMLDSHTSDGFDDEYGYFTRFLDNLTPGTTYFVRAYATNSMGTGYGQVLTFTTSTCEPITVPYFENFDEYTLSVTASTGIKPACWELVWWDVNMTNANRPQLYYKSEFAHSGDYSLKLCNRGVYAMPALAEEVSVNLLHLDMYLRQPKAAYSLQVGVWNDEDDSFEPVATFNNSTTEVEHVECDFSEYTGNGRRIAFRNTLGSGSYDYSYNYLDDITLTFISNRNEVTEEPATTPSADDLATESADINSPLGIEESSNALVDILVYPNPTRDFINVECTTDDEQLEVKGIEVIDVYGKVVRTVVGANNDSPTQINVSGLAAGMYFVRVTTEDGFVTKAFVKR